MSLTRSEVLDSYTARIETPDGTMFVTIIENQNKPIEVKVMIGKTGYSVFAWAEALAGVISLCLSSGVQIQQIIQEISNITTDKVRLSSTSSVRSGPEGVALGMMKYMQRDFFNGNTSKHLSDILRKNKS